MNRINCENNLAPLPFPSLGRTQLENTRFNVMSWSGSFHVKSDGDAMVPLFFRKIILMEISKLKDTDVGDTPTIVVTPAALCPSGRPVGHIRSRVTRGRVTIFEHNY